MQDSGKVGKSAQSINFGTIHTTLRFLVFVILVVVVCFLINFIPPKMDENITGQKKVLLDSIIQRKELMFICNMIDIIVSY